MSKPRKLWWGYVKNVVRAYPELQARLNELRQPSTGGRSDGQPGAKEASRTTENVATRTLPPQEQRYYEAVEAAIRATKRLPTGTARLKIIDLVYWQRRYSLYDAALEANYSYARAKDFQQAFFLLVAKNLGVEEKISHESLKDVVN